MTQLLSVQLAARRLGVSAHTVRRWTASGFLPCTRTAGGHRRIKQDDVDELLGMLDGGGQTKALLVHERELETLKQASLAVSSQVELNKLLAEISLLMTRLLEASVCTVCEYDHETQMLRMLANYDRSGRRLPDLEPYPLGRFPTARTALTEKRLEVVNVSNLHADAVELSFLRRSSLKSIMFVPLISRDEPIGLLQVIDRDRERRYTRQELRITRTVAAHAAVALNNAILFAQLRRRSTYVSQLCFAIEQVAAALPRLNDCNSAAMVLRETAALACESLAAVSSVASYGQESAGSSASRWIEHESQQGAVATRSDSAHVLTATMSSGPHELSVTVTLATAAADGQLQVLTLICAAAAAALRHMPATA